MRRAVVERFAGQRCQHPHQPVDRVVGQVRVGDVALDAMHREVGVEAAPAADLDHVAERLGVGRLADDAGIGNLARRGQRRQHLLGAVDRRPLLVAGDEETDRAAEIRPAVGEEGRDRGREGGDRALHVRGAAPPYPAVALVPGEGIEAPGVGLADRDHVGVAGEAEMRPPLADAGEEIVDVGRARLGEGHPPGAEAQPLELAAQRVEHPRLDRGHAGAADERLRQRDRVEGEVHRINRAAGR